MVFTRNLGRSGIQVSAIGMGCWTIGCHVWEGDAHLGWGEVDDEESIAAIHCVLDFGVYFLDRVAPGCTIHEARKGDSIQICIIPQ
ncbi:MAG: hypothetical protein WBF05_03430 [Anaerolineales bacterium]